MAHVDVLSDDEDEAPLVPATQCATMPMPEATTTPVAAELTQAGFADPVPAPTNISVDVLSDDDDEDHQAMAPTMAAEGALQAAPELALPAVTALPGSAVAPLQTAPVPQANAARPGLRSVVVAQLDLADSEDEEPHIAPQVPAMAKADQGIAASSVAAEDDSDDEPLTGPTTSALGPPKGLTASSTPLAIPSLGSVMAVTAPTSTPKRTASATGQELSPPAPPQKRAATNKAEVKEKKLSKEEVKEKKLSREEMEARVLDYMQQQNRPYNAQNVFDNLHGIIPKGQVQLYMDSHVAAGRLVMKEYGKYKVYLAVQKSESSVATEDGLHALQEEINAEEAAARETRERLEELKRTATALRGRRDAATEAVSIEEQLCCLRKRVAELRASSEASGGTQLDAEEVAQVETSFRAAHMEWRRRKRLCMEVLRSLSERMDIKVDKVICKYGVDTDEDCCQTFPENVLS